MENVKTSIVFQTIIIKYINTKTKYPLKIENISNSYYFLSNKCFYSILLSNNFSKIRKCIFNLTK